MALWLIIAFKNVYNPLQWYRLAIPNIVVFFSSFFHLTEQHSVLGVTFQMPMACSPLLTNNDFLFFPSAKIPTWFPFNEYFKRSNISRLKQNSGSGGLEGRKCQHKTVTLLHSFCPLSLIFSRTVRFTSCCCKAEKVSLNVTAYYTTITPAAGAGAWHSISSFLSSMVTSFICVFVFVDYLPPLTPTKIWNGGDEFKWCSRF